MSSLKGKAESVISLTQSLKVIDPACKTLKVDPRESISCAGVAADIEELRIFGSGSQQIGVEVRDSVFIPNGTFVPVVGDSLPSFLPFEVPGLASDAEE